MEITANEMQTIRRITWLIIIIIDLIITIYVSSYLWVEIIL